jgi:hypothetical protein
MLTLLLKHSKTPGTNFFYFDKKAGKILPAFYMSIFVNKKRVTSYYYCQALKKYKSLFMSMKDTSVHQYYKRIADFPFF